MRDSDGQERITAHKRRRFIPSYKDQTTLVEHTVVQGDRFDNIAARSVGDPTQFWHICDANDVLQPEELTDDIGRVIEIKAPKI